jgi:comEA protein
MKILDTFNRWFGFTRTESRVVGVLIAAFLLGIGVRLLRPPGSGGVRYDYSSLDSEFTAKSAGFELSDSLQEDDSVQSARASSRPGKNGAVDGPVDINRATESELVALPGIGPGIAKRIIAWRTGNGPFRSVDDLRKVKGIGARKFERVAPLCICGKE